MLALMVPRCYWLPSRQTSWSNVNIPGNDFVDKVMKQAAELPHSADLPIAFISALHVIKNLIKDLISLTTNKENLQPLPSINRQFKDYCTRRQGVNGKTTFRIWLCITSLLILIRSRYWSCLSNMQRQRSHSASLTDNMPGWWLTTTKSICLSKQNAWVAYHSLWHSSGVQ